MGINNLMRKVLSLFLLVPLICVASEPDSVSLSFTDAEVEAIVEEGEAIWIKLHRAAASRLKDTSAQAYGKELRVDVEGVPVLRTMVYATIDSALIQVQRPTPAVRKRLERLRQLRSPGD